MSLHRHRETHTSHEDASDHSFSDMDYYGQEEEIELKKKKLIKRLLEDKLERERLEKELKDDFG